MKEQVDEAVAWVQSRTKVAPQVGLVLGSGLGALANETEGAVTMPFGEVPHFPQSTVSGHAGALVVGHLAGTPVVICSGRVHGYEGHAPEHVVFPIRVLARLGIRTLVVTNAAGGVNPLFRPGTAMLIRDHLNLTARSPLTGPNEDSFGPRFPDMSEAYSRVLRDSMRASAKDAGITLAEGVYAGVAGPQYETPAEIRMLRTLGADAVGMSTVWEVIAARHLDIRVLGLSVITNAAAGILDQPLSHDEVKEVGAQVSGKLRKLIVSALPKLAI